MQSLELKKPWEQLSDLIKTDDPEQINAFLNLINPADTALAVSRLSALEQSRLLTLLEPEDAAEVIEDISDTQAADLIEELPPEQAAAILEELDSDHIADLLGELDEDDANAIISRMDPQEAEEVRQFLTYSADTAGGLMLSEYLDYRANQHVQDVLDDLQENREDYADYDVQYLYVTDADNHLQGVLRMRDLLFPSRTEKLGNLMISSPYKVSVDASLDELQNFFEEHNLFGAPVVDADEKFR